MVIFLIVEMLIIEYDNEELREWHRIMAHHVFELFALNYQLFNVNEKLYSTKLHK